ncbi:MAG TPA: NADPH:quinone oxidoreductase family protein [Acidimicrobiia bacterium]|jgi:NADPH2:quinone reductase
MRALVLGELSGPDGLAVEDIPAPVGDGARIEVHAAGVSFADLLMTRGEYQVRPEVPFVPGLEVAGVLRSVPTGSDLRPGDRVAAFVFGGGFAEEVVADPAHVVPIPAGLDFAEAAGFVVNYHTAWFALVRRAGLQPGERVLVQGAGGGLGTATVGVAKALGASVIGVASSPAKAALAEAAGASVVVDAGPDWAARVRETAAGGVDVAVDPVGGERFDDTLRCLAPGGRLVVVGFAGGGIPQIKVNRLLLRNVGVLGAAWREFLATDPGLTAEATGALNAMVDDGRLRPLVGARYPLEDGADALRALAERRAAGKLVLTVRT